MFERQDPAPEEPVPGKEFTNRFGLPTATALVVGSVIGTGVFALPSALGPYGPSNLVALVLVTVGALPHRKVVALLTDTLVDADDPALQNPTKFVGRTSGRP